MTEATPTAHGRESGDGGFQKPLLHRKYLLEDTAEHLTGQADGIHVDEQFTCVVIEGGSRFGLVNSEAVPHDRLVCVVGPSLPKAAVEDSSHQRFKVGAGQVQDELDIDIPRDQFALGDVSRDSIQQQDLARRIKSTLRDTGGEFFSPQGDCEVVGNEVSTGGVCSDSTSVTGIGVQAAKDLSAGEMEESGKRTKDNPLCALSTAGWPEKQDRGWA